MVLLFPGGLGASESLNGRIVSLSDASIGMLPFFESIALWLELRENVTVGLLFTVLEYFALW